jgi:hypothetical protein
MSEINGGRTQPLGDKTTAGPSSGTLFDQRGQHVNYQYNAQTMNFGSMQNRAEFLEGLKHLKAEVGKALEAHVLDEDAGKEAEFHLDQAANQASRPDADKGKIQASLEKAKNVLEAGTVAVGATTGLLTAFQQAAQLVQRMF